MRQLKEKQFEWDRTAGNKGLASLAETHEQELMINLSRYPEVLEAAAVNHEPHQLTYYLRELANDFHTYYNAHTFLVDDSALRNARFLVDDSALRNARLNLIEATRQVIANGLGLLGVSAPDSM
jgi:arginyl-tRNA synthetase